MKDSAYSAIYQGFFNSIVNPPIKSAADLAADSIVYWRVKSTLYTNNSIHSVVSINIAYNQLML